MPNKVSEKERRRRLAAFDETKKLVKSGSVTQAALALGNISAGALSRWLLQNGRRSDRQPAMSKEECIAGLKAHIARHKKVARDPFARNSVVGTKWKTHWPTWQEFMEAAGVINDPAKILLLDIETAPNRAFVWGTWKQNINPDWIDADGYVLCWTAKWLDSKEIHFHRLKDGKHKTLLDPIHRLLHEAHAVVHYNGTSFDIPTLNKEFLTHGFTPPSPYKQVDLLLTMRGDFRFPSNKLDYICKTLSLGEKLRHEGPQLWLDCMQDKADAWEKMEAYNRRDVDLLESLYKKLLPWIKKHPNRAAMSGMEVCPSCGSDDIKLDGTYIASQLKYERYHCGGCGVWFRGTKSINPRTEKRFALTA